MLLRAGVGKLRLVDFDQVSLSSLNRHCLAVREDVGTQKSACLAKYFRKIMPEADIESMCTMYCKESEEQVLRGSPDYVIDAIDNIDTKVDLLGACSARGLPVLSVAGAGAKADPTRLRFVDIVESCCDPLARSVRARLKRNYGISSGIIILLSTERPRCGLVDSSEAETAEELLQYQIIPNFRIRTIPVLGTTPSMFGMAAAGYVLCELAGQHIDTEPLVRFPEKAIKTQYDRLESRIDMEPDIDMAEVEVLIREIWRGESARSKGPRPLKGISKNIGDLHLTLWDPTKAATVDNLVLLTKDEAENHDLAVGREGGLESLRMEEPEFAARVERALERARRDFKYGYY
jgi:tRNA threonylcarbamoyladenosine dehydratase